MTADLILKTNYSLSMASKFLMGDPSLSLSTHSPIEMNEANKDRDAMVREAITKKLFDELLYSTRKEDRCAGTVWLLSITMYCGHQPAIQKMLPEIQVFLAEFQSSFSHSYLFDSPSQWIQFKQLPSHTLHQGTLFPDVMGPRLNMEPVSLSYFKDFHKN